MKKNGIKSAIIAYVVGAILIVAPIVILSVWSDNAGIQGAKASLYIAVFAGALAVLFAATYMMRSAIFLTTLKKGRKVQATYVSSEMKSSNSTKDFYCVTYTYEDGEKTVTATSGINYTWEQALAFKFAENFEVTVYKKHSYITQETDSLVKEHKAEIDEFKKAYAEAYNKYHGA